MAGDTLGWILLLGRIGLPYFVGAAIVLVTVFLLITIAMRGPRPRAGRRNEGDEDNEESASSVGRSLDRSQI